MMKLWRWISSVRLAHVCVGAMAGVSAAAFAAWDGTPTGAVSSSVEASAVEQGVERGRALYDGQCAACHGPGLIGGMGPTLTGQSFWDRWSGHPAAELYDAILNTMPATAPGSLTEQESADLALYVLSFNDSVLPDAPGPAALAPPIIQKKAE